MVNINKPIFTKGFKTLLARFVWPIAPFDPFEGCSACLALHGTSRLTKATDWLPWVDEAWCVEFGKSEESYRWRYGGGLGRLQQLLELLVLICFYFLVDLYIGLFEGEWFWVGGASASNVEFMPIDLFPILTFSVTCYVSSSSTTRRI